MCMVCKQGAPFPDLAEIRDWRPYGQVIPINALLKACGVSATTHALSAAFAAAENWHMLCTYVGAMHVSHIP